MKISMIKTKVKSAVFGAVGLAYSIPSFAAVDYGALGEGIANEGGQLWENVVRPVVIVIGLVLAGSNLLWPKLQPVNWIICAVVGIGSGMYGHHVPGWLGFA